jgi:hypothetical protein
VAGYAVVGDSRMRAQKRVILVVDIKGGRHPIGRCSMAAFTVR